MPEDSGNSKLNKKNHGFFSKLFSKKSDSDMVHEREEEILGLDVTEHGLESAYAGFLTYGDRISSGATTPVVAEIIPIGVSFQ